MAGRALTPLGVLFKWVLVPIGLGAAGYFLVGPRLGSYVPELARESDPEPAVEAAAKVEQREPRAPQVEVDSTPASGGEERARRRRKRRNPVEPAGPERPEAGGR